jgi:outer membrane protein assembly factor BamB
MTMGSRWNLAVLLLSITGAGAGEWPGWRGPDATGASTEVELPDHFGEADQRWSVPLPGIGAGTPAVWGDRVFVSAIDEETSMFTVLCLRRSDGAVEWRDDVAIAFHSQHRDDLAGPSPVCDAERVIVGFGSGDIAAYRHDGGRLWKRNLQKDHGKFTIQWVYASSPLLHRGVLQVQVVQTNRDAVAPTPQTTSHVLGIDPVTGKDLWKHPRPCPARGESQDSYTTPVPFETGGRHQFLVLGGDCLTGHDAASGVELWRCSGWNARHANDWRTITTPVVADGRVVLCTARGNRLTTFAARADGSMAQAWESSDLSSDVAVPLFYRGNLYVLNGDRRILACIDPATGATRWRGEYHSTGVVRASPTGGDGKIYAISETGEVLVFASDGFRLISTTALGSDGPARASIALAHGRAFVRTGKRLQAFGRR